MNKISRCLGIIAALACLQNATAQNSDSIWVCRDTGGEYMFSQLFLADTFPDNRGSFTMVDTGAKLDGYYVNFDYKFNTDSAIIKGKTSKGDDTIFHCAPRPGYAGYKIYWDNGIAQFYVSDYDSLILWHKGPLPGHKVKMVWAQGSAGCGTPINYELFGEFKSSTEWKRESLPFPVKRNYGSAPDSDFVKKGLFELRMLIYNDSSITTSPTSVKGDFKLDNMYFLKKGTGINYARRAPEVSGGPRFFVPKLSGQVTLSIFSIQGEQLFKESIDVAAGKKYNVSQFARENSNLPTKWINCIKIVGAGVDITRKLVR